MTFQHFLGTLSVTLMSDEINLVFVLGIVPTVVFYLLCYFLMKMLLLIASADFSTYLLKV